MKGEGGRGKGVVGGRLQDEHGLTLVEVAIVLVVTTALIGALAPSLTPVVQRAEIASATTAMDNIRDQLLQALADMNYKAFTVNGVKNGTVVRRLVSDGDIPREVSATGSSTWQAPVDNSTGLTDFLERHLVFNEPRGNPANAYSTTVSGAYWRGAYLTAPIDPDPWGNRYVVNSEYFGPSSNDVVVFSAGPDEQIDTQYTGNPLVAGDDDLIVLVES